MSSGHTRRGRRRAAEPTPPPDINFVRAFYHCSGCGETLEREVPKHRPKWRKSFCQKSGRDVRMTLVEQRSDETSNT